jgi:protein SCO1/2
MMSSNPQPESGREPRRALTKDAAPALVAAALAAAGLIGFGWWRTHEADAPPPPGCITEGIEHFGGPIALTDQHGRAVTQAAFAAKPAILYFGYTHCPDACPTALYALGQTMTSPQHPDAQTVFITVDPARDTPQVMGQYATTNGFPPNLVALTGSDAQVKEAADAFRVVYRKAPAEGGDASTYNVDHTSLLYVLDGNWRMRAAMSTVGASPQTIAACVRTALSGRSFPH